MKNKVLVMYSGGLDSRLAVKIMQEQGLEIIALFFKLPFGCSEEKSLEFLEIKPKIIDCTKGNLLKEYLKVIKNPKHKRGSGINPCIDCKIFMFKKAKEFADKNNIETIVSGDVLGERPMSQMRKSLKIIEQESGLKGRLLRPLSAKLLEETFSEKKGYVNREKLYLIQGRQRKKQMELAKKFGIEYPTPGGGCLLCEKALSNRFLILLKRNLTHNQIKLLGVGRHFIIEGKWIILGRDHQENKIIENYGKNHKLIISKKFPGPTAVIIDEPHKELIKKVENLILAYSKNSNLEDKQNFEKLKI